MIHCFIAKNESKKEHFFPFLEESLTRLIHLIGREVRVVVLVRKGRGACGDVRPQCVESTESTFYNFGALFLPFSFLLERSNKS